MRKTRKRAIVAALRAALGRETVTKGEVRSAKRAWTAWRAHRPYAISRHSADRRVTAPAPIVPRRRVPRTLP